MAEIPEAIHGEAGLIVGGEPRITLDCGASLAVADQHGGVAEGAINHPHGEIGPQAVAVVEILMISRVEVLFEEADAIPGERGDQEGREFLRPRQQGQELRLSGIDPLKSGSEHSRCEAHIVVGQKRHWSVREGSENLVPARRYTEVAKGPGYFDCLDQRMTVPLQLLQTLMQHRWTASCGGRAVVNDGEGGNRHVEAVEKSEEQVDPVEDRNSEQGKDTWQVRRWHNTVEILPEPLQQLLVAGSFHHIGQGCP